MAHIQTCKYCPKNVVNSKWHPECREMALEDLLYQVQQMLRTRTPFDQRAVARKILAETFRSKEEIDIANQFAEQQRRDKESWKIAHAEALRVASEKFRIQYPDPFPPTY